MSTGLHAVIVLSRNGILFAAPGKPQQPPRHVRTLVFGRECGLDSASGSLNLNSYRDTYGPSFRVVELEESAVVIDNGQGRRILNIRQASA